MRPLPTIARAALATAAIALFAGRTAASEARGPDWLILVTPTAGWLRNTTTFPIPVGRDENDELVFDDYEMTDDGWGGGFTLMGFYKRISLTSVFFGFPEVNRASLLGNISYLSGTIPTGTFVEPYLGLGLAAVATDARFDDFRDVRDDDLGGLVLRGFARMDWIAVENRVVAPFPKAGVKFGLPIQHWYVLPFYSFMYEHVRTRARSGGGRVELWQLDTASDEIVGDAPVDVIDIRAFDKTTVKDYTSHLVGSDFFFDFNYFLQLRAKVYYNVDHDLWTVRLIGSMLFNEHLGISAYFEHTQKITVTNTYFLVGPAFVFTPPGFMDEMLRRRRAAMEAK
ncbi:MAG TPA: hypothetical protein VM389_07175 [Phycisphaerae bacterium]|nr:hypothetical protein [Phycisphaerae bacterium]